MTREELDFIGSMNMCDEISDEAYKKIVCHCKEQKPCEDAISRQAVDTLVDELARAISDERCGTPRGRRTATIMQDILDLPPVNPQPKTGHWIFDEILDKHYYCSECKSMGVDYWDFCPNCGAKMVEPQERSDKE